MEKRFRPPRPRALSPLSPALWPHPFASPLHPRSCGAGGCFCLVWLGPPGPRRSPGKDEGTDGDPVSAGARVPNTTCRAGCLQRPRLRPSGRWMSVRRLPPGSCVPANRRVRVQGITWAELPTHRPVVHGRLVCKNVVLRKTAPPNPRAAHDGSGSPGRRSRRDSDVLSPSQRRASDRSGAGIRSVCSGHDLNPDRRARRVSFHGGSDESGPISAARSPEGLSCPDELP